MLYAKLIGRIALFTCENIAHIEYYLQSLLPEILAIYTIKVNLSLYELLYAVFLQFGTEKKGRYFHALSDEAYETLLLLLQGNFLGARCRTHRPTEECSSALLATSSRSWFRRSKRKKYTTSDK